MAHKAMISKGTMTVWEDGSTEVTIVYPDETRVLRLTRAQMRGIFDTWVPFEKALCEKESIRARLMKGVR